MWAAAIVAAAVGFATFATLSAATQGRLDAFANRMSLATLPYNSGVTLTDPVFFVPENADEWGVLMSSRDVATMIDAANAQGAGAVATMRVLVDLTSDQVPRPQESAMHFWPTVAVVQGDVDWSSILAAGAAPGPQQIVLPANTAAALEVGIGDAVDLGYWSSNWEFVSTATLTVSGLAYDVSTDDTSGDAFTSMAQVPALAEASRRGQALDEWNMGYATVSWQSTTPALDPVASDANLLPDRTFGSTGPLAWLMAALFTVGAIVTAFTLGRAQARSRVTWVATARALGARRAHLLGVAGLEWAAVWGVGAVVGVSAGWGAALLAHARRMDALAAPPPVELSTPAFLLALMLALAAVLATAVVAVPTLFAIRIQPTAALKDTQAADTVTMTRRVRFWPVAIAFLALWAAAIVTSHINSETTGPWIVLFICGSALLAIPVIVEASRALTQATARTLGRSRRPWAIHAAMTMQGHPQQAAALAIIQALLFTGLAGWIGAGEPELSWLRWSSGETPTLTVWFYSMLDYLRTATPPPVGVRTAVTLLAAAQGLIIAIAATATRVASVETSAASALGLPTRAVVKGNAAAWWLAQAHGAWVGASMGLVGVGAIWFAGWTSVRGPASAAINSLPHKAGAVGIYVLISLVLAGVVAGASAIALAARPVRVGRATATASAT